MSKGKLIVLEGLDGSGKATQAKLLAEHLAAQGLYLCRRSPSRITPAIPAPWSRCTWPGSSAQNRMM